MNIKMKKLNPENEKTLLTTSVAHNASLIRSNVFQFELLSFVRHKHKRKGDRPKMLLPAERGEVRGITGKKGKWVRALGNSGAGAPRLCP